MARVLKEVFGRVPYLVLALLTSAALFSFSMWLRNLGLLREALASPAFSVTEKLSLLVNFLGGIVTAVTPFSAVLIAAMSLLFGINAALFLYYVIRARQVPRREGVGLMSAFVSGILGVGCASCGSFLLGALLASAGAAGVIALLPLGGEEFSILAIGLLAASIFWMTKSIKRTKTCPLSYAHGGNGV